MKHLSRLLRAGKPVELEVGDTKFLLTKVDHRTMTCHEGLINSSSDVQINDVVAAWVHGEFILDRIVEIQQKNYLPRFLVGSQHWVGKTKIIAKAVELASATR